MGKSLSRTCLWTRRYASDSEVLELTGENEGTLYELLVFIKQIAASDSGTTPFVLPIVWPTTIPADTLTASLLEWNQSLPEGSISSLYSDSEVLQVSCNNFAAIQKVLSGCHENKLAELRKVVETNRDPLNHIVGMSEETPAKALVAMFSKLQLAQDLDRSTDAAGDSAMTLPSKQLETSFKMLMQLVEFDADLLASATDRLNMDTRISPNDVARQLYLVQQIFANANGGSDFIIEYASNYQSQTGVRSPPWRQLCGELAYIKAGTESEGIFEITASIKGYFVNGGTQQDGTMDYTAKSRAFPTLIEVLKAHSQWFSQHMDDKEFQYNGQFDKSQQASEENSAGYQGDNDGESSNVIRGDGTVANKQRNKKTGVPTQHKRLGGPSSKWHLLGYGENNDIISKSDQVRIPKLGATAAGDAPGVYTRDSNSFFSDSDSEVSEEEDNQDKKRQEAHVELPPEYWQIQKLVKYLKGGNETATVIALCSLRDFDLANEMNQLAIRDVGGLETLINLLDTEDTKCKIGSLRVLKGISENQKIRKAIHELDGMQPLVELVKEGNEQIKCLAAETIAYCAKYSRNRRAIRRYGGIRKLVRLLKVGKGEDVPRCGALALWSSSKSTKNKEAIRNAGAIPLLAKLLLVDNEDLLIPVVGIIQECASGDAQYRALIRSAGMMQPLVRCLKSESIELQTHCASAIFKLADDAQTRVLVREYGGLEPLVELITKVEHRNLLAAATGAVWKCAIDKENVKAFNDLKCIQQLVSLLNTQPEEVLINVVGAIGEMAKVTANSQIIRSSGGIPYLVNLLTGTNQGLLVNVTKAVGACAHDAENMSIIDKLDGVRLLWSLLKSPNTRVQASAAWAICPCIQNAKNAGEMVRSFVGGLELIVSLLKSEDDEVLASVCSAIANIAKDEENLAVISDHGVVPMLAKLADNKSDHLRKNLAESIANCCRWGNNRVAFGDAGAVAPLVRYLRSSDEGLHRATARALYQLSLNPQNCVTMHESGVVSCLLGMVGSLDESLQEAAAGCIGNIRRLALENEKAMIG